MLATVFGLVLYNPALGHAERYEVPNAEFLHGWRLETGAGSARPDYAAAYAAYCRAAQKGHPGAALRIAVLYAYGAGVQRDRGAAAAWVREAARRGNRIAEGLLPQFEGMPAQPARCTLPGMAREAAPPGLSHRSPVPRTPSPGTPDDVEAAVRALAPSYGLAPDLVLAVIRTESGFRTDAVSPKGAQGLMQLIPATAERFGVAGPFDPHDNIRGGMAYLRWLLSYFRGDVRLALAGYNAGEGAVDRHGGIPPYEETRQYVRRVLNLYPQLRHPFDPDAAPVSRLFGRTE
ncbi:MAG TPA: lytic transglycosylase domain-containing protein [Azospirillum sp.]|nr:lytic transglycosylase domain-containing protein [Azospirillum sp.]